MAATRLSPLVAVHAWLEKAGCEPLYVTHKAFPIGGLEFQLQPMASAAVRGRQI